LAIENSGRRPAADVDQRESLEETTIVELLRNLQWRGDGHGSFPKSSGCATALHELFTATAQRAEPLQTEALDAARSQGNNLGDGLMSARAWRDLHSVDRRGHAAEIYREAIESLSPGLRECATPGCG